METKTWQKQIQAQRETMIKEISELVAFKTVYDVSTVSKEAPYGIENQRALRYMLDKAQKDGFVTRNFEDHAGRIEFGPQGEVVGVICHLDVVSADGEWTSDPFTCTQRGSVLYGRGTNDNKGPTIAVYTALRILAKSDWVPTKKLHLILGCNEESGMKDMDYYVAHTDQMPESGFVPDCTFPVNYGEHGSCLIEVSVPCPTYLTQFDSSLHPHITCGQATGVITDFPADLKSLFAFYLKTNGLKGQITIEGTQATITMIGKSAHGSRPYEGLNAATHWLNFVFSLMDEPPLIRLIQAFQPTDGSGLGIRSKSFKTGDLSVAVTGCTLKDHQLRILIDCRYPSDLHVLTLVQHIKKACQDHVNKVECVLVEDNPGFYVDPQSSLVTSLISLYQNIFQDFENQPKVSPGDTYARKFNHKLVAFGPTTRDHLKNKLIGQAHQIDEGMDLEVLLKATEVYVEALRILLGCVQKNP